MRKHYVPFLLAIVMATGCAGRRDYWMVIGTPTDTGSVGDTGYQPDASTRLESDIASDYQDGRRRPWRGPRWRSRQANRSSGALSQPSPSVTTQPATSLPGMWQPEMGMQSPNESDMAITASGRPSFSQFGVDEVAPPPPEPAQTSRRAIPPAPRMRQRFEIASDEADRNETQSKPDQQNSRSRKLASSEEQPLLNPEDLPAEEVSGLLEPSTTMSPSASNENVSLKSQTQSSRRSKWKESRRQRGPVHSASTPASDPKFETFRLEDLFAAEPFAGHDATSSVASDPMVTAGTENEPVSQNSQSPHDSPLEDSMHLEIEGERVGNASGESDLRLKGSGRSLPSLANRPEHDLIRQIRETSSTLSGRGSGIKSPGARDDVLLTARPLPHYQQLRALAGQGSPTPGKQHSHHEAIQPDLEFDFRPLPELVPDTQIEITPPRMEEVVLDIFNSSNFPSAKPSAMQNVGLPALNREFETLDFTRLPSYQRHPTESAPVGGVVLRAIPRDVDSRGDVSSRSRTKERSRARFCTPGFQRRVSLPPSSESP